jgi:hypothetical protein
VKKQRDLERHSFWKAGEDLSSTMSLPERASDYERFSIDWKSKIFPLFDSNRGAR